MYYFIIALVYVYVSTDRAYSFVFLKNKKNSSLFETLLVAIAGVQQQQQQLLPKRGAGGTHVYIHPLSIRLNLMACR